jgi:hypothetical protein
MAYFGDERVRDRHPVVFVVVVFVVMSSRVRNVGRGHASRRHVVLVAGENDVGGRAPGGRRPSFDGLSSTNAVARPAAPVAGWSMNCAGD